MSITNTSGILGRTEVLSDLEVLRTADTNSLQLREQAAASAPVASGTDLQVLFLDSSNSDHLSRKDDTGTVVDIETAAAGMTTLQNAYDNSTPSAIVQTAGKPVIIAADVGNTGFFMQMVNDVFTPRVFLQQSGRLVLTHGTEDAAGTPLVQLNESDANQAGHVALVGKTNNDVIGTPGQVWYNTTSSQFMGRIGAINRPIPMVTEVNPAGFTWNYNNPNYDLGGLLPRSFAKFGNTVQMSITGTIQQAAGVAVGAGNYLLGNVLLPADYTFATGSLSGSNSNAIISQTRVQVAGAFVPACIQINFTSPTASNVVLFNTSGVVIPLNNPLAWSITFMVEPSVAAFTT
jgi:hypothetical protein